MGISTVEDLLDGPQSHHVVQFYEADQQTLASNVCHFLLAGLRKREGLVVVATAAHRSAFLAELQRLEGYPESAMAAGRLVFLDAQECLSTFLVAGRPDWARFENEVGTVLRDVRARAEQRGLRVYGEMVGLMWRAGQYSAAVRLEHFWNKLQDWIPFRLFCGYPIDVFADEFQIAGVDALLCAHSHLLPAGKQGQLQQAVDRAIEDVLGNRASGLRRLIRANFRPSWAQIPKGEATILWLRNNVPKDAGPILARARDLYQSAERERQQSFAIEACLSGD